MEKSKLKLILTFIALALFVAVVILVVIFSNKLYLNQGMDQGKVIINGKTFKVDLAETPEQQITGLSQTNSLRDNRGMLFIFADKRYRNFWMKDMKFPIDIIWIEDNAIIGIEPNAPVPAKDEDNPPVYRSNREVNYVLEINAGLAEKYGFKVGDSINIVK